MKKTLLAPLFSIALALFLVGCGASASKPATDAADEAQSATTADSEQATEEEPEEAPEEESEFVPESEEQEELMDLIESRGNEDSSEDEFELADDDKPYERGVIDGDTYRSEFYGLSYTLPEGFRFSSDEEMVELFGEPADLYTDEGIAERLGDGSLNGETMYCDAIASNSNDDNVMFVTWKAATYMTFTYSAATAESTRDQYVSQYNEPSEDSNEEFEATATTVEVNGEEWPAMDLTRTSKSDGSVLYQRHVFVKVGFYYCFIYMSSSDETHLDEMAAGLSSLS